MAGLTVSGAGERPFGQATGPRLKRASGSLQWNQLSRLNRSVGAGFEPATGCLTGICSYHLSYPLWWTDRNRTDVLRVTPALYPELRPQSSFSGTRDTQSAPRQPGLHEPGHETERRAGLMTQVEMECKTKFSFAAVVAYFASVLCRAGHMTRDAHARCSLPTAKRERVRACGSVPEDGYATMAYEERP